MSVGEMLRNAVRICPEDYKKFQKNEIALRIREKFPVYVFLTIFEDM